jgi:4-alpha-glucanotransferase
VSGREIGWDFVRSSYSSVAALAVVALQDLLNLGSEGRFNTPGTSQGNWTWRYRPAQLRALREGASGYLRELATLYGREAKPKPTEPAKK